MSLDAIHEDIARYYTRKIESHGPTPQGVDWASEPTQALRFVQLLKVCDLSSPLSLNDIGCGYGALRGFLDQRFAGRPVDYLGTDLSEAMVSQARALWSDRRDARFECGPDIPRVADYCVASGIFNVKLHHIDPDWDSFVAATLKAMRAASRRGFAVNFLFPLEPGMRGAPELYRPAPRQWQSHCESALDAKVQVIAGYGMREYTLLATTAAAAD
ncbi:MAG: class I SAM-dependent methyltransferase [Pseudomonadota bacterium]